MTVDRFVARIVDGKAPAAQALFAKGVREPAPGQAVGAVVLVDKRGGETSFTVLAEPETARNALYDILARYKVDPVYPTAVRESLAEVLANPGLDDEDLVDCTHQAFVTIDNDDSRDLDQALFLERAGDGYVVHYALADASYYVTPGSPLYEHALDRGTSIYLPHLCVPMLPPELSEGLISLNEDVDRRALVFVMELDAAAMPVKTRLIRAKIRSRAKLSYNGVQRWHDKTETDLADRDFTESLELLEVVGELRILAAQDRDVVQFNRSEPALGFSDEAGTAFVVSKRQRNEVEKWNEQISLLCNMEGAKLLISGADDEDVQPIFRVHPAPLEGRVRQLVEAIGAIVQVHGLGDNWRWQQGEESLADYLERLPQSIAFERLKAGIERQAMFINQPSVFGGKVGPHYALGVDGYARFSAPMREVAGIFTHKEGLERVGLVEPSATPEEDRVLRDRAVEIANEAKKRQRRITKEANKLAIDQLLEGDLRVPADNRTARRGTVMGMRASRLYVELDRFPMEIKVYVRDLEAETGVSYALSDDDSILAPQGGEGPRFRIGDGVLVRTDGYDEEARRWQLSATLDDGGETVVVRA
jgi:ribonuclease R